ncbi:MAG: NAD(P)/FAD-dependent oxidoreductase [Pseudomonadota bacterium]
MSYQSGKSIATTRRRFLQGVGSAGILTLAPGHTLAQPSSFDVLILGAGLSGLNAAYIMEQAGARVGLLEATQRVGGRVMTAQEAEVPGAPELGGSGIGSQYARLIDAARRYGVALDKSRPRTEGRVGEYFYHVRNEAILPADWADHAANPFRDPEQRAIPLHLYQFLLYGGDENPLPKGDLAAWQNGSHGKHDVSVHDFLIARGVAPQAIKLAAGTNMSYGTSAHDLSALMGFQSANLVRTLYANASGGALAGRGGNQRIPEAMARGLKTEIRFGQAARAIRSSAQGVAVTTSTGETFRAKRCICTLPFSALRHVAIEPYLEGIQAEAVSSLGYTPVFQAHFVPTRKYWEDDGLPPSMWTDQTPGRFMALKNSLTSPDEITSCLSFVNGEMAKYLDRLPPEQAGQRILNDLHRLRPATRGALRLVKTWSWNRSPFYGGAYAYWKPGQITRLAGNMAKPWHHLHFAGEHTAVMNRGMEGAMESGERAAFETLSALG